MEPERRSDRRVFLRALAEVRVAGQDAEIRAYTINVSAGGMSIEFGEPLKAGVPLTARLTLSDGQPVQVSGVVRHAASVATQGLGGTTSRHFLVGVQFLNLDAQTKAVIEAALEDD